MFKVKDVGQSGHLCGGQLKIVIKAVLIGIDRWSGRRKPATDVI